MEKQKRFFKLKKTKGDIFWSGFPVEKLGGNKPKIGDDILNTSSNLQNVFNDKR